MVHIISDTCALYSPAEGREIGLSVLPLSVTINGETYKEYEEISPSAFLAKLQPGSVPITSQPSIGEVLSCYESCQADEILSITMCNGLSGTYQSACLARQMLDHPERVHVLDSRTLAGPQR